MRDFNTKFTGLLKTSLWPIRPNNHRNVNFCIPLEIYEVKQIDQGDHMRSTLWVISNEILVLHFMHLLKYLNVNHIRFTHANSFPENC